MSGTESWPSVNKGAAPLVRRLIDRAAELRLTVSREEPGYTLVDGGIGCAGGIEAGLRIAEICMAGLGRIALEPSEAFANWPWQIAVRSSHPVLACLGSQYAGWSLSDGEGEQAFHALGSGPARALAVKEPLFEQLGYRDRAESTVLVLEVGKPPPRPVIDKVLRDCDVSPENLTIMLTPTESLAGTVQVVGRVLEVALHKAHELGFPLDRIVDGLGSAPLPPPAPKFLEAMGRTNDAIIYGGRVQLFVTGPEEDARQLAEQLPSRSSRDYGKPFAEAFKAFGGDFYQIDPMLFSPAQVAVTALDSGKTHRAGGTDPALIDRSFA